MGMIGKLRRAAGMLTLSSVTRSVLKDRLTYLPIRKLRRIEWAIKETMSVPGDIVEFGLALGGSGIILAHALTHEKRFHGLDIFGMIPPPESEKDDAKSKDRYQTIASGRSKGIDGTSDYYGYRSDLLSDVKASFTRHGVPVDGKRIVLHKGLFEETWPGAHIVSISLAHIDCDWYDPVKYCLAACLPCLSPGGLIVIDDYNDYGGCRTAVDEFLEDHQEFEMMPGVNPILRNRICGP